jgi:hypothetical protein
MMMAMKGKKIMSKYFKKFEYVKQGPSETKKTFSS